MKLLLDTNILLHRESKNPVNQDIGRLFSWIDKLGYEKCIHQVNIDEIEKIKDENVRKAFLIKIDSYHRLPTVAPLHPVVREVSEKYDTSSNDLNDTALLNEVYSQRVDLLLTEDRKIHKKALKLGIDEKVFTIDSFLEKVTSENPDLVDYNILSVRKEYFGNINIKDDFFESLKEDYQDFEKWFAKKSDEKAYICLLEKKIIAFLYLKLEKENELYSDIRPNFSKKRRLKIGTFKVDLNGYKLGERFLKIIFDNAIQYSVDEIYVTIFPKSIGQLRLINLLKDFGFAYHGKKESISGEEDVYVREFSRNALKSSPKTTYPYIDSKVNKYLVSIYPEYHTSLLPDSILCTESSEDYIENEPHRNAISKIFISRSFNRDLNVGDIIIFYRTGGYHKSVITTLGIVENIHTNIQDEDHFISLCRKRSVFSTDELIAKWNEKPNSRPFVVNFLYTYSFPKRLNLKRLIELGVIKDRSSAPRGFEEISDQSFEKIISETGTNRHIIIT
ncbi:hypothetical protein RJ40_02030 [Methanofollis aquaemaris]|uniref:N-acetyltransferase domain-containing protein n=1 Tax=Methanofollis aquaemaris TaxID=126734 RepID=A0A8A3S9Y2_9EURY|nr:PIN domain-containing protein [Methanofollis aquaemaris]QSZ68350.1 hypothetical protein RJ40_02030 [Methanofollis aquaemaris]